MEEKLSIKPPPPVESKCCVCKDKIVNKYVHVHDIRNGRSFTKDILADINTLSYEDRMKILVSYNEMFTFYSDFINDK
jgi:hypothetical protein